MDFYAVLDQVLSLLQQRGRVTYRALKLQFQLDDDALEVLKDEITRSACVGDSTLSVACQSRTASRNSGSALARGCSMGGGIRGRGTLLREGRSLRVEGIPRPGCLRYECCDEPGYMNDA
jgi:hypothetical protein